MVAVLAPMFAVEKLDIAGAAVVSAELETAAQGFRFGEDVPFFEMVEDLAKFAITEGGVVVGFELVFQVGAERGRVGDGDPLVAECDELSDQLFFELGFGLGHAGFLSIFCIIKRCLHRENHDAQGNQYAGLAGITTKQASIL